MIVYISYILDDFIRLQQCNYLIDNNIQRSSKQYLKIMIESANHIYQTIVDKNKRNFDSFKTAVSSIPIEKSGNQQSIENETSADQPNNQLQTENERQNLNESPETNNEFDKIEVQANKNIQNHPIETKDPQHFQYAVNQEESENHLNNQSQKQDIDQQQKLSNHNNDILNKVQSDRQLEVINLSKNSKEEQDMTISRIKQIEQQKRMIQQELRKLDSQIQQLRGGNEGDGAENDFKKREKISRDIEAEKKAVSLVKQLHKQRKQLQAKKKKQQEKLMKKYQMQEQLHKKARQQQAERAKQQRRLAIEKRMNEQKKRRQERKMIDAQSNQLIAQLRKQDELEKQKIIAPSQLFQVEHRKRVLENKKKLDFAQIQQHQKKYQIMKAKQRQEKKQRQFSLKHKSQQNQIKHYGKNRWMEQLEEEERRKKQQQYKKQELRKNQLEKRLKYGQLVKNIFIPKARPPRDEAHLPEMQETTTQVKPHTPDQLPKVNQKTQFSHKRRTYDQKMNSKQQTLPAIKDKRSMSKNKNIKIQEDPDNQEKQKLRKIRELELRKQTNERLKKLQNKSVDMLKKTQQTKSHKYENYLGHFKPKRKGNEEEDLKKILSNDKLTSEQKYRQLMNKAALMQKKAKVKQDFNKEGDQQAVNLYIGSIQAKLALLQKF